MDADAAPDIGKLLGHRPHAGKAFQLRADSEANPDPGGTGACHHVIHLASIIREIEVAMAVDQEIIGHHNSPPRASWARATWDRSRAVVSTTLRGSRCRPLPRPKPC